MLLQEIENHIATLTDVRRIHRHLSKEIFSIGHNYGKCSQTVPEIIERKKAFGAHTGTLIAQRDEGTPQFNGVGHIFLQEFLREVEHMTRGQFGLSVI